MTRRVDFTGDRAGTRVVTQDDGPTVAVRCDCGHQETVTRNAWVLARFKARHGTPVKCQSCEPTPYRPKARRVVDGVEELWCPAGQHFVAATSFQRYGALLISACRPCNNARQKARLMVRRGIAQSLNDQRRSA